MSLNRRESTAGDAVAPPPEAWLGAWSGSAAPVYCRDWSGRVLAANAAFARRFGRSADEFAGTPLATLVHADDLGAVARAEDDLRRPPHRSASESRWLTPQGWRWIGWEEAVLPDGAGIRAIGHDITRLRVAEQQFRKLSSAIEQSPAAIAITDAGGRVEYVNARFTAATGYTLEDILEREIDVLREGHPDDASYQRFWETVRAGREWRGELARHGPDGARVWESVQVVGLRNEAGEVTHLLCQREDITERRLLEEQLRQAQKMESLGTLAGGIAHDFNNILAVINGYAELCLIRGGEPVTLQKSLREIRRAADRASGLVRQILTFSRKAEVRFAPLDLNQQVRDLVALLAETFPRNIGFQLTLEDNLPALRADPNQFQQIVLNLCVNARDAMPGGGTITLATARMEGAAVPATVPGHPPACACLSISDTGTGMTPEVRARIFEPFFTTKAATHGTGLGLAVVYGIVASHGGALEVDTAPGVGSAFRIYLPLSAEAAAEVAPRRAGEFPGGSERVLVVDDETPLRLLLEAALSQKGYTVEGAHDGRDAIARLDRIENRYDAVVLDLNMPGATGLEVLRHIHATRPALRVLLVSGHLTTEARAEFEALGQKDFLRKPYPLDELGRQLRGMLDRA
ncbi:MAG TPA: PAS domain S-box protein [Opitutaceae bacterium]|nr:PAS domain S-box protein [Opitutaceae bacterium]